MMRVLLAIVLVALHVGLADAQVYTSLAGDPAGYNMGFARSDWVPGQQSILYYYGHGSSPTNNNSVRLYKPSTNTWSTIYPNSNGATGPVNRDNHNAIYVNQLDQLWVWGGTFPAGTFVRAGRFSIAGCVADPSGGPGCLLASGTNDGTPFVGVVKNFGGGTSDTGWAWSEECNCGLGYGGGNGGNNRYWVIEPNTAGSPSCNSDGTGGQPYVMCEVIGGTRPQAKTQCMTCLVAVGSDFYLAGGSTDIATPHNDLWKFDTTTRTWTQLANAPVAYGYQSMASYDSDLNLIVVHGWGPTSQPLLLAYDIDRAVWGDLSYVAAGQGCAMDATAAYAPTVKKHIYLDGNQCPSGDGNDRQWGISLSGARLAGELLLAPGLWVSRPMPPNHLDARSQFIGQTGFGPSVSGAGAKHQRFVYVPETGRIYAYSGDFNAGSPFTSSFRAEMFSYNIGATDRASSADHANWRVEHPFCGPGSGAITTGGSDETAFVWDSSRKIFWYVGGFENQVNDNLRAICLQSPFNISATWYGYTNITAVPPSGDADVPGGDILTFDPITTKRWTRPAAQYKLAINAVDAVDGQSLLGGGASTPRNAIYNAKTDEIIQNNSGSGPFGSLFVHMNVSTGTWRRYNPAVDQCTGSLDNSTLANHEQLALDPVGQYLYFIDIRDKTTGVFRLRRYNIATKQMRNFGTIPVPYSSSLPEPNYGNTGANGSRTTFPYYAGPFDSHMLFYDTVNNKVLWPATNNQGRPILLVFTPPSTPCGSDFSWSVDPMLRDRPSEVVYGSNGVYVPELNAMMQYGGFGNNSGMTQDMCPGCAVLPSQNYFWLYRFAGAGASGSATAMSGKIGAGRTIKVGAGRSLKIGNQ